MAEDERGMAFTTETDFEEGKWVGGEFYAKQRGGRRAMTKEDHLYGVFNNAPIGPGPGSRKGLGKSVGFVKAGDTTAGGEQGGDNVRERRGVGSGGATARRGLGSGGEERESSGGGMRGGLGSGGDSRRERGREGQSSGGGGLVYGGRGGGGGGKQKKKKKKSLWATSERRREDTEDSTAWQDAKPAASWEKFTKGIGSKLMMRQGWKPGTGLGKGGRGVNRPIEVKQRPMGMGMGYNNFKEQSAATRIVLDPKVAEEMKALEEEEEVASAWKRKGAMPARKREKTQYKTVEEVLENVEKKQVIVDMRSGEEQVLSSAAEVSKASAAMKSDQRCAELQFNTRMLADMAELEIQRLGKGKGHKEAVLRSLEGEMRKLEVGEKKRRENLEHLKAVQAIVAATAEKLKAGELSLSSLSTMFELLRSRYPGEYAQLRLGELAIPLVLPLLKRELATWMPLAEPTKHLDLLGQFSNTLRSSESGDGSRGSLGALDGKGKSNDEQVFDHLVEEAVVPRLRTALQNNWPAKEHESALVLLEAWKALVPPHAFDALLLRVVLPKLKAGVEQWDPHSDPVPIHLWLHPWLPWLHEHLELLYGGIRRKMQQALLHWTPVDGSALLVLEPWASVFPKEHIDSLLKRCILPKLQAALKEVVVNPLHQDLSVFVNVLLWHTVAAPKQIARMLETDFFPKFLSVLHAWLNASPAFEELYRWYVGWKELFPAPLLARPRVRAGFHEALRLIDASLPAGL